MEYKYFLIKVFINTFDQLNVPLVNKSINFFQQKKERKGYQWKLIFLAIYELFIFEPICANDNHD